MPRLDTDATTENVDRLCDLDDALANAEAGLGHSQEQVFEWMDAWAAGDKKPIPTPDILPR